MDSPNHQCSVFIVPRNNPSDTRKFSGKECAHSASIFMLGRVVSGFIIVAERRGGSFTYHTVVDTVLFEGDIAKLENLIVAALTS